MSASDMMNDAPGLPTGGAAGASPDASSRSPSEPPPGWNADEVFRRFESRTNLERTQPQLRLYRLERMEQLLRRLGSPERRLPVVHVAGSKGKGSTSSYIASLLAASGYTVGLYTSPHVRGYRERFAVIPPGRAVGELSAPSAITEGGDRYEHALAEAGYELWRVVESMLAEGTDEDELPTTFELLTALAFLFFPRIPCDRVVLETGLGGRLDATNVCRPEVSVITRIELEHTDYLGDTIARIATEKAGIIKEGIPVITAAQRPEAAEVFERIARERSA
ncbi:MAG: bifunctional folylpolyglutamate synthase/dihydrofolate synthase, partial [Alkalispirochaeta sp.]